MVSGTLQKLLKYAVRKLTTSKQGHNTYKKCYRCWHITDSSLRFQVWQKLPTASQVNLRIFLDLQAPFKDLQGPSSFSSKIKALSLPLYSRMSGNPAYRWILLQPLDTFTTDLLRRIHIRKGGRAKSGKRGEVRRKREVQDNHKNGEQKLREENAFSNVMHNYTQR